MKEAYQDPNVVVIMDPTMRGHMNKWGNKQGRGRRERVKGDIRECK
jgi:hypothetical protein